jgi:uncharacterized protein (TIGR03086 family)
MSELPALLEGAFAYTRGAVAGIRPDQRGGPTPCPGFDVAALLAHLVGAVRMFGRLPVAGTWEAAHESAPAAEPSGALAEYDAAAAQALDAWRTPQARERTYPTPWGELPGEVIAGFLFLEVLVHGWDLAVATGQDGRLDPALAEPALEMARQWVTAEARTPTLFGHEVPVTADAAVGDRLVAFLGRHPGWTPASA